MAAVVIPLSRAQIEEASGIAEERSKKYGSDFGFNLTGALGEVAVAAWAAQQPEAAPVDKAFVDPERDNGPDLVLAASKYGVDVKTCDAGDRYKYKESQVPSMARKGVRAVIWAETRPVFEGYENIPHTCAVQILGWSTAEDVESSSPAGEEADARTIETVRELPDLLTALKD
jgi:hypothetical protein